jgi:DNA-directed RNA polymerase II subunit RPB1
MLFKIVAYKYTMSNSSVSLYQEGIIPIDRLEYAIFANKTVRETSVVKDDPIGIYLPETYDNNDKPVKGGIVDGRLGTTDMYRSCDTCGLDSTNCITHFGHTDLPMPIYPFLFLEKIKDILSCFCQECYKLLVLGDDEEIVSIIKNNYGKYRLTEMKKKTKKKNFCPWCNAPKPNIIREISDTGSIKLIREYLTIHLNNESGDGEAKPDIKDKKHKTQQVITPYDVLKVLRKISKADAKIVGFDSDKQNLEDLIILTLCISALSMRPSTKAGYLTAGSAEDDLTKQSIDILKQCEKIRQEMDKEMTDEQTKFIITHMQLLQYMHASFQINNSTSLPKSEQKSGGKPIVSVSERISGKKGRIRYNLDGKRTDYCARSVIISDPNIKIDDVGVPMKVAMTITFPETVTPHNIDILRKYVKNGRYLYPGANYISPLKRFSDGKKRKIDLKHRKDYVLKYGDIVERHMLSTDVVMFNRQPSLHRPSIMCHKPRPIPNVAFETFRLNVNVTEPYGADFDGDEMNLFYARNIQTQVEILLLASVEKHIISVGSTRPIIKFKQDTPAGLYMMTVEKRTMHWRDVMIMAASLYDFDVTTIKKKNMTSHQVFSLLLPSGINYESDTVSIVNGELMHGAITNKILNSVLIIYIWEKYGSYETKKFIDNAQRLAESFIFQHGLSLGYGDTIPKEEFTKKINAKANKVELDVLHSMTEYENNPNLQDPDTFESFIFSKLAALKPDVGKLAMNELDYKNNFFLLIESGAKGSQDNVGELMGPRGQVILRFARIPRSVNGRMLPHLCTGDDTPRGRGFIKNSYNNGMDPIDFWVYHQAGREGLINTAIKTAETGYQYRKMARILDSIMVYYDGTVRTSSKILLQLVYGDNGFDQTKQKRIKLNTINMGNTEIRNKFKFSDSGIETLIKSKNLDKSKKELFTSLNNIFYDDLIDMRNEMRQKQLNARVNYNDVQDTYFQSSNYKTVINDYINYISQDKSMKETPLDPIYVLEQIEYILDHKQTPVLKYNTKDKNRIKHHDELRFKYLFRLCLMEYLAPKRCIDEYKLTKEKFDMIVQEIIDNYEETTINAGEMVGVTAAQSMGEPLTQMTLSSFHKSGSGVVGLQGGPRVAELLSYTKDIKTPVMLIYLKKEFRENKVIAHKIASGLRYTVLEDLIKYSETVYDPLGYVTQADDIDVNSVFYTSADGNDDISTMHWVLRIVTDRETLLNFDINMLDVKARFISFWNTQLPETTATGLKDILNNINNIAILTSNENSETPSIHFRYDLNNIDGKTHTQIRDILSTMFYLKGDGLITKIDTISHDVYVDYDEDGKPVQKKEYVIYTNGINFSKTRKIKYIDQDRTICNKTETIYKLYGIEAGRMLLLKEIGNTFSAASVTVNYPHIAVVCDHMTSQGYITSVDRNGVSKISTDTLARASFEKTMAIFVDAAIFSEVDNLTSVSSKIIIGSPFQGGTGYCSLSLDTDMLETSAYDEYRGARTEKEFNTLTKNPIIDDVLSKTSSKKYIPDM